MNEPVAWMMKYRENGSTYLISEKPTREQKISHDAIPLYTHPHSDKSVKAKTLTDKEIVKIFQTADFWYYSDLVHENDAIEFARAILRKAQDK